MLWVDFADNAYFYFRKGLNAIFTVGYYCFYFTLLCMRDISLLNVSDGFIKIAIKLSNISQTFAQKLKR